MGIIRLRTICMAAASAIAILAAGVTSAFAQDAAERGEYLVTIAGCGDCHTPGYFMGKPDMAHPLSGSEVGFEVPGMGVFYGANLTPDPTTGIGDWSEDDIVTALRTGKRPDGRELAPIMPWRNLSALSDEDAYAIAAYLKSLEPVENDVLGPFGPDEQSPGLVMKIVAPAN